MVPRKVRGAARDHVDACASLVEAMSLHAPSAPALRQPGVEALLARATDTLSAALGALAARGFRSLGR